jgi:hypothetical protein
LKKPIVTLLASVLAASSAYPFAIVVDYTYDTNNFFNTPAKREAMQAAADRYARIIDTPLLRIDSSYKGGSTDWRIGFTHPGTGGYWEISTAPNTAGDALFASGGAANVYNPNFVLPANTWILFAGGRPALGSAGEGGTGTGLNFVSVLNDVNGPTHRGAIPNTPGDSTVNDLPAWGGTIAFNSDVAWSFDLGLPVLGTSDFYSIALHEIGHALGLSSQWNQWKDRDGVYGGIHGVAAYNADNGTARAGLNEVSDSNPHWQDGAYDAFIFALGAPNYVGTVGPLTRQDLLMEPTANFGNPLPQRFELTNVDVAALRDLSWSVIPEPSAAALLLMGAASLGGRRRRGV